MRERERGAARQELYRPHGRGPRRPAGSTFNGAMVYDPAPGNAGAEPPAGAPIDAAVLPARETGK